MTNILATLAFYTTYPGWHSFDSKDRATANAIKSLEKRGYLEVVSDQARLIVKVRREIK